MRDLLAVPARQGAFASQGRIADDIIVREDAVGDDIDLVQAVVDYVNRARNECLLAPGEYPSEADWSYYADYYLAQVNNGGHSQYAHNSGLSPAALRDCRFGLWAMGAQAYLAIFDEFLAIMSEEKVETEAEGPAGFLQRDPRLEPLDTRFFVIKEMLAQNAAWLRRLPQLKPVSDAELEARFADLRAANVRYEQRKAENDAARRSFQEEDPSHSAAHACAAQEGATLERLTAGSLLGPSGEAGVEWGALTSKGNRTLSVYWGDRAEWRDEERALKGYYYYDTKGPWPAEAGTGKMRAEILKRLSAYEAPPPAKLADFYFVPLADFARQLSAKAQVGTLVVAATGKRQAPYVPRKASKTFDVGQRHAQFRLFFAAMLYDLAVFEMRRSGHGAALKADNDTCTVMAASCALAAAGAASIRLLEPDQIAELSRRSHDDFTREQINVALQMREISDWWQRAIWKIGAELLRKDRKQGWAFLRPTFFEQARRLLQAGEYARKLDGRLAYFTPEYPDPSPVRPGDVMLGTISALEATEDRENRMLRSARIFEMIDDKPGGEDGDTLVARLTEPGAASKAELVPQFLVIGAAGPSAVRGGVAFDFDAKGDRLALGA